MFLQVLQVRCNGSFSNSWRCEGSLQAGETAQVTASETSLLATHRTIDIDDGSSHIGMAVFLGKSRERSSRDGMTYGSLIDDESPKIKKTVLSTTVAELHSFMKCFVSCQFLPWNVDGHIR